MNNKISYKDLRKGVTISFRDQGGNPLTAIIEEVYVADNDESKITGCLVSAHDGVSYVLYEEDGVEVFSASQLPKEELISPGQEVRNESETTSDTNKVLMPTNNQQPPKTKKEVGNLFQGRTEPEKGNAKFPNWDIIPPNQFINPRVKQN